MLRKLLVAAVLTLSVLMSRSARVAEPLSESVGYVPESALVLLEVPQPKGLLDTLLSPQVLESVNAHPAYQTLAGQKQFVQVRQVVALLESTTGVDWKTGLRKVLGGGITWAVMADGGNLLIVDSEDEKVLENLHQTIVNLAKGDAAKRGQPDRVSSSKSHGATIWSFGGSEAHALLGKRLLLSNRRATLESALAQGGKNSAGLAKSPAYQTARKWSEGATATALVNFKAIKRNSRIDKALSRNEQPWGALLLAGMADTLRDSSWLAARLDAAKDGASLRITADGKIASGDAVASFAWPGNPGEGALPNLKVPHTVAAVSLYRDLRAFYSGKEKLFPERTSGLVFFENMMEIFFSGRDLTGEVWGEAKPEVRLVVARQQFDQGAAPQVELPGFALIFGVQHPQEFAEVMEEAWQKGLGFVNFTRGQKAQPGMILDRPSHQGVRYTTAHFSKSAPDALDKLAMRYNFQPSLAKVGQYLVLSSSEGLAKDLIDALNQEAKSAAKPLDGVSALAEVNGGELLALLNANRKLIAANNMVKKGISQEEADSQLEMGATALARLNCLNLCVSCKEGRPELRLEVKANPLP